MKKVLGIAAIAAMFVASSAMAATLELRVVTDGDSATATVTAGDMVNVFVQARLDGGGAATSDGLALWGSNIKDLGADPVDLCDTSAFLVTSTAAMGNFDRVDTLGNITNFGLTNPSASPNLSGYSGTCDSSGGLWQLGGGQNTIGNTPGGAPYPIGTVDTGIANGGWITVAEGMIATPGEQVDDLVLTLDTAFANTINTGQAGVPYSVTEVASGDIDVSGALTISFGGTLCVDADVNCDGNVDGLDIAAVKAPGTWLQPIPGALNERGDANGDGNVDGLDIAFVKAPGTWLTSTGPCTCP